MGYHVEEYGEAYVKYYYKALARTVLVGAVINEPKAKDGWRGDWVVFINSVPGYMHDQEWLAVAKHGEKLSEELSLGLFPFLEDLEQEYRP